MSLPSWWPKSKLKVQFQDFENECFMHVKKIRIRLILVISTYLLKCMYLALMLIEFYEVVLCKNI